MMIESKILKMGRLELPFQPVERATPGREDRTTRRADALFGSVCLESGRVSRYLVSKHSKEHLILF